ncbi:hypothetical protein AB0F77_03465 [Streptomyces sp. NPDC026672]|uniref:esterase/lipase family protein n=1 Tax=unclassified Streptomyces TaxID=2593676 RepID=UPI0033F25F0A
MPERDHLVVVLPGIGGSVLAPPDRPDRPVWTGGPRSAGLLARPERLSVGARPRLLPVGLVRDLTPFGVWTAVHGYDRLMRMLAGLPGAVVDDGTPAGRDPDATVVAFPYDFRLGAADAARRLDDEITARLARLWPGDDPRRPRVIVVAHSMGGLVARYWLTSPEAAARTRALLTLGTPHRGAPKALDVLTHGIDVKVGRLTGRNGALLDVLRGWPAFHELLPRHPVVADTARPGVLLRPHEVPLPWLTGPAAAAFAVHRHIEHHWDRMPRGDGPETIPRIGYGHSTLRSARWDGTALTVTKDAVPGLDVGDWAPDLGDGTVPAYSALPLEMERHSPDGMRTPLRHGPIGGLSGVAALVESYERRPAWIPVRGEERPVVLGADLDEVAAAGHTVPVSARLRGATAAPDGECWAVVTGIDAPTGPAVHHEVALDRDGATGAFHGELPALGPGLYRVRLAMEEVPDAGDVETEDVLEVVDADGDG